MDKRYGSPIDIKTEFRYGWTKHLEDGGFLTARGDTITEVTQRMGELEILRDSKTNATASPTPSEKAVDQGYEETTKQYTREPVEEPIEGWCVIHGVQMKEREGKFGKFYSHSRGVYPDMEYCSGYGFGKKKPSVEDDQ